MKWMNMFEEWDKKFAGSEKLSERIDKGLRCSFNDCAIDISNYCNRHLVAMSVCVCVCVGVPDAVRAIAWLHLARALVILRFCFGLHQVFNVIRLFF
jgi:hypothetical protein